MGLLFFLFPCVFCDVLNSIKLFHIILVSGRPFILEGTAVPKRLV